jgi:apoptosis-inducing factor 2
MAAEVKNNYPECEVVLVHSRDRLLSAEKLPDDFKDKVLESLTEHGVQVMLGRRVVGEEQADVKTDGFAKLIKLSPGGESLFCDEVIYSSGGGNKANTGFMPGKLVDEQGCVLVRPTLQFATGDGSPNTEAHFAIGDAASWSGVKRVGGAQSMAGIAATNVVNMMLDAEDGAESRHAVASELASCPEFEPRMSLALGATVVVFRPPNHVKWGKELKGRVFGRGLAIDCEYHPSQDPYLCSYWMSHY